MSKTDADGERAPRIPFATEVEVRFEEFGEFVTEYSNDLSLTGMFLRTTSPHPPGSSFQFEFQIVGGQPLIRGVAPESSFSRKIATTPASPWGFWRSP